MKKVLKLGLGFVISGTCLWFAFKGFEFSELKRTFQAANLLWIFPATFVYCFGYVIRTWRWQVLLSPLKKTKTHELFPVLTFGFLVNNILPARAGEFLRALAARHLTNVSAVSCFGSIAVDRVMDMFGILFLSLFALQVLPAHVISPQKLILVAVIGCIGLGAILFISAKFENRIKKMNQGFLGKMAQLFLNVSKGFAALKSWKKSFVVVFLAMAVWMNEAFSTYLFSRAFNLNFTFPQAAALIIGLSVGVMIPAAPGFVGTYELFGKATLVRLGFAAAPALSFVIVLHFFQLSLSSLMGLPYLFKLDSIMKYKKELKEEA